MEVRLVTLELTFNVKATESLVIPLELVSLGPITAIVRQYRAGRGTFEIPASKWKEGTVINASLLKSNPRLPVLDMIMFQENPQYILTANPNPQAPPYSWQVLRFD